MRRFAARLTAALLPALGMALFPLPAAAADDAAAGAPLISLDGKTFSEAPEGSIFRTGLALVPGGTATGTFYVKNDSARAADLRISVAGASSASVTFLDALSLEAVTPATPQGTPVPLSSDGDCIPLLADELLRTQQVTAVRITIAMDTDAGNLDQGADANAALVVALTDPAAPDSAEYGCTAEGGVPLLPTPDPGPRPDRPLSETTDPTPAINGPQRRPAAKPDGTDPNQTGVATPAAETPPTAGALPLVPAESQLPLTWLGTAGLALGAAGYLLMRLRKRDAG